ncbi:MAG: sigma-54 dependent transcriptional regulator [Bacteroidales bacterium]|nr:sigma-54 dependent transcriptional regulator [Bacteroidales bacterium]MDZ4203747.1 sigma-54 dependent transcriptional regulator [Bacteroidales bacterium]
MPKVLIVDDDSTFCLMLKTFLSNKGYEVKEFFSANAGLKALREEQFDIVLTDYRLPDKDGIELLKEAKALNPHLPVILMTRYADIRTAVHAMKLGAHEYVAKPINPDEILLTISQALSLKSKSGVHQDHAALARRNGFNEFRFIEGQSASAQHIMKYVELVAPTDISVIILGESGTGKEYVARMIHIKSRRNNKPFMAVDCGALSKELAGSELFGHMKGSFTDAHTDKEGQFQMANGGTLFLDEIGNLSYEIQLKLLRATQEKKVRRIGGTRDIDIDVRIIVASNEDLQQAVRRGAFREDLYHRLNEFRIEVAPLRQRHDDISLFAYYFLELSNRELNRKVKTIDDEVMQRFLEYAWPGNIRELKNVIKRAVLLSLGDTITLDTLPSEMALSKSPGHPITPAFGTTDLKAISEINERNIITQTLEKVHYNKTKAANLLNIDRKTLYNKMKQYNIEG